MTADLTVVGQDHIILNLAIMAQMTTYHKIVIITNNSFAAGPGRAAMDGYSFTKNVVVANFQFPARILQTDYLRFFAQDTIGKNPVITTDFYSGTYNHIGF